MANFVLGNFNIKLGLFFMLIIVAVNEGRENTQGQCVERERQALLRFKESLVDDGHLFSSWKSSDQNCCAWKRIRCDNQTNHIIMLDLDFSSSFSEIIVDNLEWLSYLPSLRSLTLGRINFSNAFDWLQSIKSANSLSTLDLFGCQFPEVDIWSLSHINSSNSLRALKSIGNDIPPRTFPWLLNVSRNLVNLTINGYDHPLPNSFGNLTSLEYIDLSRNFHLGIPKPWGNWCSLKALDLSHTNFNGTFHDLLESLTVCSANSLETLSLWGNQLGGIIPDRNEVEGGYKPKSWGYFCSLKTLDLSKNNCRGTLYDLLQSLTASCSANSLEILALRNNRLGGSIPDMKTFPFLKELDLYNNELEGPFPDSLSQLPKLLNLNLDNNQLTGPLPHDLSHMSSLRKLRLANNKLNSTIPETIGQLSNLRVLDFSSNSFTGVISGTHLQKLFNLKQLALSFNSLTLNFNSSWVPLFQLSAIKLSCCKLGPQFPKWVKTQQNISIIDLYNSSISDTIPNWFCNLTSKLKYLNLSFNHISGTLPNFPLNPDNYPIVDLSSNQIHGAIPRSLSNATILHLSNNKFGSLRLFLCTSNAARNLALDLSNNLLFESLPDCWMNFWNLSLINLENNKLFGVIPSSMGQSKSISNLRLSRNNFSGDLPSSLKNCTWLQVLDVGENNLKGEIPTWIGERLTNLVILRLKSNKLRGSIPLNLCHLQSIRILDLSFNNISGTIPSCMDNFTSMVQKREEDSGLTILFRFYEVHFNESITWKGVELHYGKNIGSLRLIDLSRNKLTGEIPKELTNLVEVVQLNFSRNNLKGTIPEKIGQLNKLESLDLSHNHLSGKIPTSLADITFLGYLDLSNNHLSGRIPTGTQLQSFNASQYVGNPELCGQPLNITCPGDKTLQDPSDSSGDESYADASGEWLDMSWFRMGIKVGFAIGFSGVCLNLWLNTSWRLASFRFFHNLGDWLYVTITVKVAILKRTFSG